MLLVARGIVEVPKTGGCPRVLVTPPRSYRIWSFLAADSASIYWQAGYGIETYISSLWRAPRGGGIAARLIAPGALPEPGGTYLTPTQIWWTTNMAISVMDRF